MAQRPDEPRDDARPVLGSFIGIGGMACMLFVVLASGEAGVPWWGIGALSLVWLVLFVVGTRWFMTHPRRVAALPVVMLLVWLAVVTGGVALLDWSA